MVILEFLVYIAISIFLCCDPINGEKKQGPLRQWHYDCHEPGKTDFGTWTERTSNGFIASAFAEDRKQNVYQILDYNIVCLTQGKSKNKYSFASAIVKYEVEGFRSKWSYKRQINTKQLDLYCKEGKWRVLKKYLGTAFSSTNLLATLQTPTRYDCKMCIHPKLRPSSETEHCVSCPHKCRGRCSPDGSCCNIFDLKQKCALTCPKKAYKADNMQCKCIRGQKPFWGRCVKQCNCQNNGTCDKETGKCICPEGFRGLHCQKCKAKPGCKQCHFDKMRKEYTCKNKHCEVSYIKEPPNFSDINCNPYQGNGYSLQCGVKVERPLLNKVEINWKFIKHDGERIDLNNPSLSDFIEFSKTVTDSEDMPEIYSTLVAKFDDTNVLASAMKEVVFSQLKGGILYCEASILDSKEKLMPTNYLTLPIQKPIDLPSCKRDIVYTTNTNRCAMAMPPSHSEFMSLNRADDSINSNQDDMTSQEDHHYLQYNNYKQNETNDFNSGDTELDRGILKSADKFYNENEGGLHFQTAIETTSKPKSRPVKTALIASVAILGAIFVTAALLLPLVIVLYKIKKISLKMKSLTTDRNNNDEKNKSKRKLCHDVTSRIIQDSRKVNHTIIQIDSNTSNV